MEDRCPGVLRLHAAADGHLLRIRLPGGDLTVAALEAIGALADLGNGIVELTSRASVQVRGLALGEAAPASELMTAAGLLPSPVHDRVRNILASPLVGRIGGAPLDGDALVARLDRGICADPVLAALPGRFLFAVEDGSGILGGGQADVTLVAEPGHANGTRLRLHLAGMPTTRTATPDAAAEVALEAARAFLDVSAAEPRTDDGVAWRISDLAASERDGLLARLDARVTAGPALGSGRQVRLGLARQADGGHAVTVLAPLGRLHGDTVRGLAALAASSGGRVRVSPWRTLSVIDVPDSQIETVVDGLAGLGLVIDDASGWRGLSACAGLGACANARIDVRAAAADREDVRRHAGTSETEHWSACERRCGRPLGAAHLVTATSAGIEVESLGVTRRAASVEDALALLAGDDATRPTAGGGLPSRTTADRPVAVAAGGPRR